MCEPTTIVMVGMAAMAALSAVSSIQQGKAAAAAGDYKNAVARNNATLAQRRADDARQRGEIAENEKRKETALIIANQRAVLAANGIVVDTGSALDITTDTAEVGEVDALTLRANFEREALGFEAQGMNFINEGQMAAFEGAQAQQAARMSAIGSVIGGATQIGGYAQTNGLFSATPKPKSASSGWSVGGGVGTVLGVV